MQSNQPPKQQDKTAVPAPGRQNPEQYEFGLWKLFRAMGFSILITAGLVAILQFVFKIKFF